MKNRRPSSSETRTMATNNSTQHQPSLAPTSSSSDSSSSSSNDSPTRSTKPPPQEWLLEYVTSHVTKNKNSPPNKNNMNQEWSMQKVICIAISIIIYIGIILWLLVSISSGDEVTISSSSKTCDIIPDGGQSNNSDNMSCSSTSVGDDVSIHRGKEIGPNIKASDVSASFLFIFQPYSICGALFLCIHISIPMHIL